MFTACTTQWRVIAGMGGAQYQGLEYPAIYGHPRFARLDFDSQDELLEQIRRIEAGALNILNKRNQ